MLVSNMMQFDIETIQRTQCCVDQIRSTKSAGQLAQKLVVEFSKLACLTACQDASVEKDMFSTASDAYQRIIVRVGFCLKNINCLKHASFVGGRSGCWSSCPSKQKRFWFDQMPRHTDYSSGWSRQKATFLKSTLWCQPQHNLDRLLKDYKKAEWFN